VRCRKFRRSSAAAATSREGHRRCRHQPRRPTLAKINLMSATRYAVMMLRNAKTLDHYNYLDHYDYLDLDIVYPNVGITKCMRDEGRINYPPSLAGCFAFFSSVETRLRNSFMTLYR
jgi:hypothetical protein